MTFVVQPKMDQHFNVSSTQENVAFGKFMYHHGM